MVELFAKVSAAAIMDRRLSADDLKALAFITKHANRSNICWPKVATIAAYMQVSERQVQRYLRKLRQLGYLTMEPRPGHQHGRWPMMQFRVLYPEVSDTTSDDASSNGETTSDVASNGQVMRQNSAGDATETGGLMRHQLCHPEPDHELEPEPDQYARTRANGAAVRRKPKEWWEVEGD